MKMAPLFLSLGPNCSESAAPETLRCTSGEGGRDRAVAVCGRSYINTACVDNAAGRMGAEGLCGAGDEAPAPFLLQQQAGWEARGGQRKGRRGASGRVVLAVTDHGLGGSGHLLFSDFGFPQSSNLQPGGSRRPPAGGLHQ